MALGGARPGAGRPKGSVRKPHISDYWSEEQIQTFFINLYERAEKDPRIAVWCGEQLSGKATQKLEHTGEEGGAIQIDINKSLSKIYGSDAPGGVSTDS